MRVLIADVFYLDERGRARGPGFILVKDGRIEVVREGEPVDEEKVVDLIVGGRGRLAIPGFGLGLIAPETYLFKSTSIYHPGDILGGSIAEHINGLSNKQPYYLTIATLYELAMNAFTRVILVSPHFRQALDASRESGLDTIVLIPLGCRLGDNIEPRYIDEYFSMNKAPTDVTYGLLICEEKSSTNVETLEASAKLVAYVDKSYHTIEFTKPFRKKVEISKGIESSIYAPLSIKGVYPWAMLSGYHTSFNTTGVFQLLATEIHKLFEENYQPLKAKSSAHIAIVDISEPPGWIPSKQDISISSLGPTRPRIETLIVGDEVVVDGGEHLLLGRKVFEEAEKIF